jgi:hypothetical protein
LREKVKLKMNQWESTFKTENKPVRGVFVYVLSILHVYEYFQPQGSRRFCHLPQHELLVRHC